MYSCGHCASHKLEKTTSMHSLAVILSLRRKIWKFTIILFPQLGAGLQIYILKQLQNNFESQYFTSFAIHLKFTFSDYTVFTVLKLDDGLYSVYSICLSSVTSFYTADTLPPHNLINYSSLDFYSEVTCVIQKTYIIS